MIIFPASSAKFNPSGGDFPGIHQPFQSGPFTISGNADFANSHDFVGKKPYIDNK